VQFAAVAHVAIPEFEEEGGTVKVVFHECAPAETGGTHLPKIATTQDADTADQIEALGAQLESSRLILRRHLDMSAGGHFATLSAKTRSSISHVLLLLSQPKQYMTLSEAAGI